MSFLINPYRFGAAAATDPYFSNVSLLLHGDASPIVDSSGTPKTITAFGNAGYSTAQKKFGSGSIAFDGNGDYLQAPASPLLTLGTSNFTVEFWVKALLQSNKYPTAIGSNAGTWGGGAFSFHIDHESYPNKLALYANANESPIVLSTTNVCDNAWHFCCVTRSGNTWRCFVDGNLESTNTTRTDFLGSDSLATRVGFDGWNGASGYFNGYIDDLRITKGVVRYTANFTPPTAPFPDS